MTVQIGHDYAVVGDGVRLHYGQAGEGRLMLFLHGFPEFWYAWRRQLVEFATDHRAVAPDMRGYNLSDKPTAVEAYRMRVLVEDVRQLVIRLGDGRPAILVGHDWGGAVAWAFAIRNPELLDRLVIVNAPHPATFDRELRHNAAQQKASRYIGLFRSEAAEARLSAKGFAALASFFQPLVDEGSWSAEDLDAYRTAWRQPGALTAGLNYYRAWPLSPDESSVTFEQAPDPDKLAVRVPTLVVWGERDTALLPGLLDGLEEYVPRLTICRIPDAGHWIVHERPDALHAAIREFLQ